MNHDAEVALGRRLLRYLERPEDSLVGPLSFNDNSIYTDAARFNQERQVLFRDLPLVLGFTCQMPNAGDFLTDHNTGIPVLLTRGQDGQARAFLNICRHRSAIVAEKAEGNCLHFACPYHGWVFDTRGRLVSIPDGGYGFEGLNKDEFGLLPLPVAERHGMIWVLPNPAGKLDLGGYLEGLDDDLEGYGLENHVHFETRSYARPMNWKLISEGFCEGYHLKVLHKQTIDSLFHPKITAFDPLGKHHRMAIARKSVSELATQPERDWKVVPHTALVYSIFPNTVLVMQGDHIETTRIFPGKKVDECVVHFSLFAPELWKTESARIHWQRNMDLLMATVEQEDFRASEGIQHAANAGLLRQQVHGRYEPSLAHFHRTIRTALGLPAALGEGTPTATPKPLTRAM